MCEYEIHFVLANCGMVKERITANSDYQARQIIRARYGAEVRIIDSFQVRD